MLQAFDPLVSLISCLTWVQTKKTNDEYRTQRRTVMLTLAVVVFTGWLLAATIGSWAYFAGEGTPDDSNA